MCFDLCTHVYANNAYVFARIIRGGGCVQLGCCPQMLGLLAFITLNCCACIKLQWIVLTRLALLTVLIRDAEIGLGFLDRTIG